MSPPRRPRRSASTISSDQRVGDTLFAMGAFSPAARSRWLACAIASVLAAGGCAPSSADLASGDLALHARADGSFDLVVAGRTLLSGAAAPVEIQQFDPAVDLLWGQFDYQTGPIASARPSRFSSAALD